MKTLPSRRNFNFPRTSIVSIVPARACAETICTGGSSGPFFFGGGEFWRRGPNLPPASSFSTDLGHFILKLLNFDIYFLFYVKFLTLFSRFGGAKQASLGLWGHGPKCPLDPPMATCSIAPPIYQWLADVQNSRMWLADDFVWYRLRMAIVWIKLMITKPVWRLDQRWTSGRGGTIVRRRCARAHVQMHPHLTYVSLSSNGSLAANQIWTQSAQPFARSEKRGVHVCTCRCTPPQTCVKHLSIGSLVAHKIWTQSAQPFARYGKGVCTCACADALHLRHM